MGGTEKNTGISRFSMDRTENTGISMIFNERNEEARWNF